MKVVCFSLSSLVDGGRIRRMLESILCTTPDTALEIDHRFLNLNGGRAESWLEVSQKLANWGYDPNNLGRNHPIVAIEQSAPFALELACRPDFQDCLLLLYHYNGTSFTVHGFHDRRVMTYMQDGEPTNMMLPPLPVCA